MTATVASDSRATPTPAKKVGPVATPAATAPKKSRKKLVVIVLLVMVAAGGLMIKKELLKPFYKAGQPVPPGTILSLDQVTVNMSDGHLVQATVALQLTKVANSKEINGDIPRFENTVITVLGAQTYQQLLAPQQRQVVRRQILTQCQGIVGTVDGHAQQISAVYFTGLVMQ